MIGGSFSTGGFHAVAGMPKPARAPRPPAHGVGAGLSTPSQHVGGLNGLRAAPAPPGFSGYGTPPRVSPTQAAGAGNAAPGSPAAPSDPYDSQYYIDLAAATAKANNAIAGYNADISNAGTNLQTNQQTLARNLALQTTATQNAENARGGFGLGALGTRIGNLDSANEARATALNTKYAQDKSNWNAAITGAQNGLGIETIALQLASADRKAKLVANSGGTLGTSAPAAPTAPAAPAAPAAPPGSHPGPAPAGSGKPTGASLTGLTAARPPKPTTRPPTVSRNRIGYHGGF